MDKRNEVYVINRHGQSVLLDMTKIDSELKVCCEGISNVSPSDISVVVTSTVVNGCSTKDIQETVIKAAESLTRTHPNYDKVTARLTLRQMYKTLFENNHLDYKLLGTFLDDFKEGSTYDKEAGSKIFSYFWDKGYKDGTYSAKVYESFTEEERKEIASLIDFRKDLLFTRAALKQLENLYLSKNKVTKELKELPQIANLLIAVSLFYKEKEDKLNHIKRFYDCLSDLKISLSTPIRSLMRLEGISQYISCVVVEGGDSISSIRQFFDSISQAIVQGAGLGAALNLRAANDPIKKGRYVHSGLFPFARLMVQTRLAYQQGGLRSGNLNLNCAWWDRNSYELMISQDEMLPPEKSLKHIDITIGLNKLLIKRAIEGKDVILFSRFCAPDLIKAYSSKDPTEFEKVYTKYEEAYYNKDYSVFNSPPTTSLVVNAAEYLSRFNVARSNSQKLYYTIMENINSQGTFLLPVSMTNLCVEILLLTKELGIDPETEDVTGEIATCILAAVNLSKVNEISELQEITRIITRALDNLIDYQDYPLPTTEEFTKGRRSIGIGVVGLAHYLAKKRVKQFTKESFPEVHKIFEALNYFCTKASVELAKERGKCKYFEDTIFSKGKLLIDTYNKNIDSYCNVPLYQDWEGLRKDLLEYGIRNSTLNALMPSEASAVVSGTVNGIEPPLSPITIKQQPTTGMIYVPTPDVEELKEYYHFISHEPIEPELFFQNLGIIQKFTCQGISANYYSLVDGNGKVKNSDLLQNMLYAAIYGIKTMYYDRTIQKFIPNKEGSDCFNTSILDNNSHEVCEACSI